MSSQQARNGCSIHVFKLYKNGGRNFRPNCKSSEALQTTQTWMFYSFHYFCPLEFPVSYLLQLFDLACHLYSRDDIYCTA